MILGDSITCDSCGKYQECRSPLVYGLPAGWVANGVTRRQFCSEKCMANYNPAVEVKEEIVEKQPKKIPCPLCGQLMGYTSKMCQACYWKSGKKRRTK